MCTTYTFSAFLGGSIGCFPFLLLSLSLEPVMLSPTRAKILSCWFVLSCVQNAKCMNCNRPQLLLTVTVTYIALGA
jgi:hypothetical protein